MNLDSTAILALVSIGLTALIGVIIAWAWKKIVNAASLDDLEKTEKAILALEARIDLIGSRFMDQFQKFEDRDVARFEKFETEIKQITREGISSGLEARKEQWKEIRDQGERVASIEGYLSTQNGYKPRPRGGG